MTEERAQRTATVRSYWNSRIHDLEMTTQPVGSPKFFEELDEYRFDKLAYLPQVIDFNGYRGKRLVEVGCGVGTDLVRFAKGGARVLGVDLSETAVGLAKDAAKQGSTYPAVFNAANEEAVMAFHAGRIRFTDIVDTIEAVLSEHTGSSGLTVESVLDAERWARARTHERLAVRSV